MLKGKRPVPEEFPISSPFMKERTIDGVTKLHWGIDFACPVGTPIKAFAPGKIVRASWENEDIPTQGYGKRIYQEFDAGKLVVYAIYAHLSEFKCKEGDLVKEGDTIGFSGNTGRSTGPHLHLEFRRKNSSERFDAEFYS